MRISVHEACHLLEKGKVVAIPTETVYGLAASIKHLLAIAEVFRLKKRPTKNPLNILLPKGDDLKGFIKTSPPKLQELTKAFWPGPLSIVLEIDKEKVPSLIRANLPTAGFRVANHMLTAKVLEKVGPVVGTSANLSGKPSATLPKHIEDDFGKDFPILDGGPSQMGVESTIISYIDDKWYILRKGMLPASSFKKILGYEPKYFYPSQENQDISPADRFQHYSPKCHIRLETAPYDGSVPIVIGFTDRSYQGAKRVIRWGPSTEPETVLQNLYESLRQLDRNHYQDAWIDINFPRSGAWQIISERLKKASKK